MNFLRTLFWVVVAVSLAIFATRNWNDVTINLWGNIQAEVKLPVHRSLANRQLDSSAIVQFGVSRAFGH